MKDICDCKVFFRSTLELHRSLMTFGLLFMIFPVGCSPAPDMFPAGTQVAFRLRLGPKEPLVLGPKSSQMFLDMLATTPVRSDIGNMPAAPMGFFLVGENVYLWHGNGVILGEGSEERLWHGPYLQKLIEEVTNQAHESQEEIQKILDELEDELENDPNIASTVLEGPGSFPGGGDVLHPKGFPPTEENGWKKFEPKQDGP